jgi:hypothetical protein
VRRASQTANEKGTIIWFWPSCAAYWAATSGLLPSIPTAQPVDDGDERDADTKDKKNKKAKRPIWFSLPFFNEFPANLEFLLETGKFHLCNWSTLIHSIN